MKNKIRIIVAIVLVFTITALLLTSCKKEEEVTTVTDIDGNIYNFVVIGTQTWMAENLKTTKLNDGTAISNTTDNQQWSTLTTPAYAWYNNSAANKAGLGALYNFFAVSSGKLCPSGWHVPSKEEWKTLETHLGGESVAGGKMKESGTTYWTSPNTGATNDSKFNGRGGGVRLGDGTFSDIKNYGLWWTSTAQGATVWFRSLQYANPNLTEQGYGKINGLSVRCIKD
jgi:uncharacterized protein (TIGR02145 family)